MNSVPPVPAAAEVPKLSQARRLALAFQAVFGQAGRNARGPDQRVVIAHLKKVCAVDRPVFQKISPDSPIPYDPIAAAMRDGARAVYLIIERQLEIARKEVDQDMPKTKPKVKRG